MVGVILAAGNGMRLKKGTGEHGCKVLERINNLYLIEFALNNLLSLNIGEVFIVVGKHGDLIRNAIGSAYKGVKVSYVRQPTQKGLIHAFVQALNAIKTDDDVVMQLADEIFIDMKTERIKTCMDEMLFDFYCGVTYENNPDKIKKNFSIETDEDGFILKCTEKPEVVTNNLKGTGFCIFRHIAIQLLLSTYDDNSNSPNDLCDYLNYLIAEKKKGVVFCLAEKEFNINTLADLEEAKTFFTD